MAQSENVRTKSGKPAPDRAALRTTLARMEPPAMPLTYGSWMELGLAARQVVAAAPAMNPPATRSRRRA